MDASSSCYQLTSNIQSDSYKRTRWPLQPDTSHNRSADNFMPVLLTAAATTSALSLCAKFLMLLTLLKYNVYVWLQLSLNLYSSVLALSTESLLLSGFFGKSHREECILFKNPWQFFIFYVCESSQYVISDLLTSCLGFLCALKNYILSVWIEWNPLHQQLNQPTRQQWAMTE